MDIMHIYSSTMPRGPKLPDNLDDLPLYLRNIWIIMDWRQITQAELARRIGKKSPDLGRLLRGEREGFAVKYLAKVAEALGVPPSVFFVPHLNHREIFDEMSELMGWVMKQPSEVRWQVIRFGILSYKMYKEEINGEIIETPKIRLVKR